MLVTLGSAGWQYRRARRAALAAPPEERTRLELERDERRRELWLTALIAPVAAVIVLLAPFFFLATGIPK